MTGAKKQISTIKTHNYVVLLFMLFFSLRYSFYQVPCKRLTGILQGERVEKCESKGERSSNKVLSSRTLIKYTSNTLVSN